MATPPRDVDAYLEPLPPQARAALQALRETILGAAPGAVESIGYGMPAFKYRDKPLAYFAAWKKHCALYGLSIDARRDELSAYDTAGGTIRFRPDHPLPASLVRSLIRERVEAIEAIEAASG